MLSGMNPVTNNVNPTGPTGDHNLLARLDPDWSQTPFAGYSTGDLVPAGEPAPVAHHLFVSGPSGVGKTRRVLAPAAAHWDGPVLAVSSKPDLMEVIADIRARAETEQRDQARRQYLLDFTGMIGPESLPAGITPLRLDPTRLIDNDDDALDIAAIMMSRCADRRDPFWHLSATPLLAGLLRAAGTDGIEWAISAAGNWGHIPTSPKSELDEFLDQHREKTKKKKKKAKKPGFTTKKLLQGGMLIRATDLSQQLWSPTVTNQLPLHDISDTTWFNAGCRLQFLGSTTLSSKLRSNAMSSSDRTIGSVAMFCELALAPWTRSSIRPTPDAKIFTPDLLTDPRATLYIVAPNDGVAEVAVITALDAIARRWRINQSESQRLPRLLMVLDEVNNIAPWPKLPVVVTEARSMGINVIAAAQNSQQFARRYGPEGMWEMRRIFPSILLLTGATEPEIMYELLHHHQLRRRFDYTEPALPRLPAGRHEGLLIHNAPPTDNPADFGSYGDGHIVSLEDISRIESPLRPIPEHERMIFPETSIEIPDFHRLSQTYRDTVKEELERDVKGTRP